MDRKRNGIASSEVSRQETLESESDGECEETLKTYTHLRSCIIGIVRLIVEFGGYGIVPWFEIKFLQ
jgi:hypothetical protein